MLKFVWLRPQRFGNWECCSSRRCFRSHTIWWLIFCRYFGVRFYWAYSESAVRAGIKVSFCRINEWNSQVPQKRRSFCLFYAVLSQPSGFSRPQHVNIITQATFPNYFCEPALWAKMYGFKGKFKLEKQNWNKEKTHLITLLSKI